VRCAEDRVPIGVFVQQAPDDSRIHLPYEVAGLALVRDWAGERFVLDEYRAETPRAALSTPSILLTCLGARTETLTGRLAQQSVRAWWMRKSHFVCEI
jgi:hypothetical protein